MNLWTPERVETLKAMRADGKSAAAIGAAIGISRNAVIGKASRLGLVCKSPAGFLQSAVKRSPKPRQPKAIIPPWHAAPPMQCEPIADDEPPADLITFDELTESTCRFPYGDRDYLFCGKPPYGSMVYCANHCMRCFQPR